MSNGIKSEDCICLLAVEIRSNGLQSTEFVTYLDSIKTEESVFSISPQCDIELRLMGSNRKTVSAGWHLKFDQIDFNRRNFFTYLDAFKEKEKVISISPKLSRYYWQMRWYWTLSCRIKSEDCICWLAVEIRSNRLQSTEFVIYLDSIKKKESVISISPQLSGNYWQMRCYWTLSNRIKSEDCICWLALEIRSNWLQSTEFVTYMDSIKEKESVFSISPQLSGYYWQMRWYWALSSRIKSVDCICWLAVEIRSKKHNSTEFVTYMQAIKKKKVYFHQYFNCQDITDKWGDIEICLMGSNRKTVSAGWQLKFDQINFNRRNVSLTWMQLRKKKVYFQYHFNCQDITDKWARQEMHQFHNVF